jgi:hypothetical protein
VNSSLKQKIENHKNYDNAIMVINSFESTMGDNYRNDFLDNPEAEDFDRETRMLGELSDLLGISYNEADDFYESRRNLFS